MPSLASLPSLSPAPTLLMIDADPDLRVLLDLILTDAGYATVAATTLGEARAQLALRRPDLIISEVWLTDAPPFAVLDRCMANVTSPAVPVLLCTGAVAEVQAVAPHLAEVGVSVLTKPFDIDDLLAHVRRLCPVHVTG